MSTDFFLLYSVPAKTDNRLSFLNTTFHLNYGQSQEKASSQDEQAQTPETLQGQPPQEAHLGLNRAVSGLGSFSRRSRAPRAGAGGKGDFFFTPRSFVGFLFL